ncbi:uncharacterized protein cubi_02317 [Cryptosporidium ubiquitum]|uniref:Uncharacterized protein n=1 Tax=Cryptosporidium ubiquitum TaxID=857276 RepID=A0A1J4MFS3_9CRYT|nr:uncharacterized protein cubi_02317 [Cryptosporidium ubiquitum]OII73086.1 hypothetical protein cubi_02317 [Cryptosporidium ubiquitum]
MPNASITIRESAICSIEYFEELLDNIKNENEDFVPIKDTKKFLSDKIGIDIDSFLSESGNFFIRPDFISFIEFWRLYEELLKYSGLYNFLQNYDGILNGMVYLRDRIINELISHGKMNSLAQISVLNNIYEPRKGIGITVGQIHTIILEIISNVCNDGSSAYWQDVLTQIPQEENSSMFLELIDISNSILQWLKEYLNILSQTSVCSTKAIVTRILSIKEETNHNSENDDINCGSEKTPLNYQTRKADEKTEFDIQCISLNENCNTSELYLDSFETLPWKGQTMFSNFRELQISLQSILERVILNSDKGKNNYFLKKDEIVIRKISHMITELEDYLYNRFDVIHKERDKFEQLEIENKNLKRQLKVAIEESEEYKFEIQNSITQKNKYEKEVEHFLSQKDRLSSDIIRFKEENKSLEKKYQGLLYNYNELKESHEILHEENQRLISEINKYKERDEIVERRKHNNCLAEKKDDKNCLKLDQDFIESGDDNFNSLIYCSIPKNNSKYEESTKESSNYTDRGNFYKSPAIIKTIPDFLESSIQAPISCRSYRQKIGYFPEKTIDKELRIVSVVSPVNKRNFEDFAHQRREKNTITQKKKNLSKMIDEIGCTFQ